MLVLPTLHSLLSQVVSPGKVHTAALLTPTGELVSAASNPQRPKDEIRVIVGLSGEVWQETKDQGRGMVESEVSGPQLSDICAKFISLRGPCS